MNKNNVSEILNHDISWFVDSNRVTELDQSSIDHIKQCIEDGISQGSLCVTYGAKHDKESNGWWRIINWKNIALDLYNSVGDGDKIKAAKKQFDENW